jgi:hypothetical protein
VDENWFVWLMEVNANPSLNVYNDKVLPNGDIEQTLSELDKFVKTNLIADSIALVTKPLIAKQQTQKKGHKDQKLPDQS